MPKVNELFSGIGAFRKALINCGIEHRIVGISEVDKYAIASYEAIYGQTRNYGDISKIEKLDYADMWTYGFPCQDISLAGHKRGIVKGETRSGLLYEVQRLLETSISCSEAPKFLIMENVKNLVGVRFKPDFDRWVQWLSDNGYVTHWKVMKAADYGIPQRRERVIAISIRQDIHMAPMFQFPQPQPLKMRFRDLLEDEADEKYFLSVKRLIAYEEWQKNNNMRQKPYGFKFAPIDRGGAEIAKTLRTRADDRCSNYIVEQLPDSKMIEGVKYEYCAGVYDVDALCSALATVTGGDMQIKIEDQKTNIRRLTPREYWRLMGFDDADFDAAQVIGTSDTQLYRQAGNSIVVNVLMAVFAEMQAEGFIEAGERR